MLIVNEEACIFLHVKTTEGIDMKYRTEIDYGLK